MGLDVIYAVVVDEDELRGVRNGSGVQARELVEGEVEGAELAVAGRGGERADGVLVQIDEPELFRQRGVIQLLDAIVGDVEPEEVGRAAEGLGQSPQQVRVQANGLQVGMCVTVK